jgi:hypothetical protein
VAPTSSFDVRATRCSTGVPPVSPFLLDFSVLGLLLTLYIMSSVTLPHGKLCQPRVGTATVSLGKGNAHALLDARAKTATAKGTPKKREMKEGPTILLITNGLFWEPTMLMKTKRISRVTHDVIENTGT